MKAGKQSQSNKEPNLTNIETLKLRDRLNKLYYSRRSKPDSDWHFDYLWDLKEKALLEGRSSVEIPSDWLDYLESSLGDRRPQGH